MVQLTPRQVKALQDIIDKNLDVWINIKSASELLGVKPKTILNNIYAGKMPKDVYRQGYKNKYFFNKAKLMGL